MVDNPVLGLRVCGCCVMAVKCLAFIVSPCVFLRLIIPVNWYGGTRHRPWTIPGKNNPYAANDTTGRPATAVSAGRYHRFRRHRQHHILLPPQFNTACKVTTYFPNNNTFVAIYFSTPRNLAHLTQIVYYSHDPTRSAQQPARCAQNGGNKVRKNWDCQTFLFVSSM